MGKNVGMYICIIGISCKASSIDRKTPDYHVGSLASSFIITELYPLCRWNLCIFWKYEKWGLRFANIYAIIFTQRIVA